MRRFKRFTYDEHESSIPLHIGTLIQQRMGVITSIIVVYTIGN